MRMNTAEQHEAQVNEQSKTMSEDKTKCDAKTQKKKKMRGRCYNCKKQGHREKDCWWKTKKEEKKVQESENEDSRAVITM